MYQPCDGCGETMPGIRDKAIRTHCVDCGGESLTEYSDARIDARQKLKDIYADMNMNRLQRMSKDKGKGKKK